MAQRNNEIENFDDFLKGSLDKIKTKDIALWGAIEQGIAAPTKKPVQLVTNYSSKLILFSVLILFGGLLFVLTNFIFLKQNGTVNGKETSSALAINLDSEAIRTKDLEQSTKLTDNIQAEVVEPKREHLSLKRQKNKTIVQSQNQERPTLSDSENKVIPAEDYTGDFELKIIASDYLCALEPVKWQVNNPNEIDSFLWNFGDGTFSKVESPTHTFVKEGTFTVSLTTKNYNSGNINSTELIKEVVVYNKPTAEFVFQKMPNGNIKFNSIEKQEDIDYKWFVNDKLVSTESDFVLNRAASHLELQIKLEVSKNNYCKSTYKTNLNLAL
ncbi:MAG: PKD domain-containing protein [Luteibaculaceae bacterium]